MLQMISYYPRHMPQNLQFHTHTHEIYKCILLYYNPWNRLPFQTSVLKRILYNFGLVIFVVFSLVNVLCNLTNSCIPLIFFIIL